MYVTIQEATKLLGVSRVTIYDYINKGLLIRSPESRRVELASIYELRERRKEDEKQ